MLNIDLAPKRLTTVSTKVLTVVSLANIFLLSSYFLTFFKINKICSPDRIISINGENNEK